MKLYIIIGIYEKNENGTKHHVSRKMSIMYYTLRRYISYTNGNNIIHYKNGG